MKYISRNCVDLCKLKINTTQAKRKNIILLFLDHDLKFTNQEKENISGPGVRTEL